MKVSFLFLFLGSFLFGCVASKKNSGDRGVLKDVNTARNHIVKRSAADNTEIRKIELTEAYTIISMSHTNIKKPIYNTFGLQLVEWSKIRINLNARLLSSNGQKSFRLLRAEGIPVDPLSVKSYYGDKTNFVLYFERLTPGIEVFDLFECKDSDSMVCWNFYDIQVNNPATHN